MNLVIAFFHPLLQLGKENGEPEARKFRGKANPRSSVNSDGDGNNGQRGEEKTCARRVYMCKKPL